MSSKQFHLALLQLLHGLHAITPTHARTKVMLLRLFKVNVAFIIPMIRMPNCSENTSDPVQCIDVWRCRQSNIKHFKWGYQLK